MKKLELTIEWKTNEYYELNDVTLLLTDETISAVQRAQAFLSENPDVDSARVRIDEDCISSMSECRLGYGFVIVSKGDLLYFIGTDHYDSANQVETDAFTI